MSVAYDPTSPAVAADPYPVLRRLQEEDPVHWSERLGGWVLTRYSHVRAGLRDPRLSAERIQAFFHQLPEEPRHKYRDLERVLSLWTVFLDPPDHTRLRRLLGRWFGGKAFEGLRPRIQAIVDDLIDGFADRPDADLIRDLAYPLPVTVIAEVLGIPRGDVDPFKTWSDELALFVGRSMATPRRLERAQAALRNMEAYFRDLVEARRGSAGEDVMGRLIDAEERGTIHGMDELVATCTLLLFAGHETTTNLIGNGVLALLRNPDQMDLLRSEPDLIETAVEEFLRYDGPGGAAPRVVKQDHEVAGTRLGRGDRVYLMVNAANRDPRRFDAPDRLDLRRDPNPHLAFGHGVHFCLGAHLARLEAQVTITTLLRRLPEFDLAIAEPEWRDSLVLRGVTALPLSLSRDPGPRMAASGT